MEHTLGITAAALLLTALIVIGLFALSGFFEKPEIPSPAAETAAKAEEPTPQKLTLGIFEGKLALFIGESPYPNRVYEFFASSLPESDKKRLEHGIEVASEEELFALLEDLTS